MERSYYYYEALPCCVERELEDNHAMKHSSSRQEGQNIVLDLLLILSPPVQVLFQCCRYFLQGYLRCCYAYKTFEQHFHH
jgi:hypothetical protein